MSRIAQCVAALMLGSASGQLIGPGSPWLLDASFFPGANPFVERFGNAPTECKDQGGAVVPCKQINILHGLFMNEGPVHVGFALYSGLHLAAKWINEEQLMLPGYELVIHTRDTQWSAATKDMIVADEIMNTTHNYAGTIASFNLDGGFVYLLNKLRMPLLTGNIGEQMANPTLMPAAWTAVNHAGHALDPTRKLFQKCSWKRVGIIVDPLQFNYEAVSFKQSMEASGYTVDFFEELNRLSQLDTVVNVLKQSRTRVVMVFAEAVPMVWLVCAMHLQRMGRILLMQWPGIPWFLNAGDAQDDQCKDPGFLVRSLKNQYIGWYPLTMDGGPTTKPLTCHPNKPKAQAQGEVMEYMAGTLAAGGVPFGAVAHMAGGFDPMCLMVLYLQHMLFNKSYTLEQVAARTPEIYDEYLNWAWPSFHGAAGEMFFDKIYDDSGNFAGQRKTNIEIVQITGEDFTKSPYLSSPPPWDVGMVFPNYVVNPDGSVVDGFLDALTFEDGSSCPADHFPACQEGEELVWGQCTQCQPGSYFDGLSGKCVPCMMGMFQPEPGKVVCNVCLPGTFSNVTGAIQCEVCEPGSYRPAGTPATQCLPCGAGEFSTQAQQTEADGMAECQKCPLATFAPSARSTACRDCPAGFTTDGNGHSDSSACQCSKDSYESGGACVACPDGLTCPFGSSDAAGAAVQPKLLPGFWSAAEDPLKAFQCASPLMCLGGVPSGGCAENLEARACAHAASGYILMNNEAIACTLFERSAFLFPIIPLILGGGVVFILYKLAAKADEQRWKHWRKAFSGLGFIVLNHYQLLNILRVARTENAPSKLADILSFWTIVSDVLSIFKPPCMGMGTFWQSLALKSLGPVIVLMIFLVAYGVSRVAACALRKDCAMSPLILQQGYFTIIFSFFTGIAQMAFTVVVCGENPSGKSTLLADRSVLCYEGDWFAMLVIGLLSILCWCIGFGGIFSYVIYVAPKQWSSANFRVRWAFLFVKFRSGLGWFSIAVVAKGVMTNVGFVFLSEPLPQIYWTVFVMTVQCGLIAGFRPWRIMAMNLADLGSHLSLVSLGFLLTWFVERDPEDPSMDDTVQNLSIINSFLAMFICLLAGLYVVCTQEMKVCKARKAALIEEVREACQSLGQAEDGALRNYLETLQDFDFSAFVAVSRATRAQPALFNAANGRRRQKLSCMV